MFDYVLLDVGQVEAAVHVQDEPSVGVDMSPEQPGECAAIFFRHPPGPLGLGEYLLK